MTDNKRIATNTFVLYIRMLFTMCVSLYTSRIILNTLGVEDYGIYNVVGGITALFCFITASMTQAIQRFITFELGKSKTGNPQKAFSIGIQLQIIISTIIVVLLEIVGIWMLYNELKIPYNRLNAAFWVLQCSIFTIPISLLSSPYNALIIAHEKMQAFAYISVIEVMLKLLIVYILLISSIDKLIMYGILNVLVTICIRMCYTTYCSKKIKEAKFVYTKDFTSIGKMVSFAGWNMYGALSYVGFTQGLNILLNMFFNPAVNAARGIAVQVQTTIYGFIMNFQTAINPQITKTYASNDLSGMHTLICRSAKFSFLLLLILSFPIILEAPYILKLWLKLVPEDTVVFVRIIIITSWITTIENPITYAVQATGIIKNYLLVISTIRLFIVPIAYILLKIGFPAYSAFIVHFIIEFLVLGVRLKLVKPLIDFQIKKFFSKVIYKDLLVFSFSAIIILTTYTLFSQGMLRLLIIVLITVIIIPLFSYYIAFDDGEKNFVMSIIKRIIYRR